MCSRGYGSRRGAKSKATDAILKIVDEAKRYAEGTAVRIEVRAATDTNVVKTLAKIKLEN